MKNEKEIRALLKKTGLEDHQVNTKMYEIKSLSGWVPVSLKELSLMNEKELSELKSFCWHDGEYRCQTIGIRDLNVSKSERGWDVSFSDNDGDPHFEIFDENEPIHNIGDGTWNYGLFKHKE